MPPVEGVSCCMKSPSRDTRRPRPGKDPEDHRGVLKTPGASAGDLGWFHLCLGDRLRESPGDT